MLFTERQADHLTLLEGIAQSSEPFVCGNMKFFTLQMSGFTFLHIGILPHTLIHTHSLTHLLTLKFSHQLSPDHSFCLMSRRCGRQTVTVSHFTRRLFDTYLWSNCGLLVSLVYCVMYQCFSPGNQWSIQWILWPSLDGCWFIKYETLHQTSYPALFDLAKSNLAKLLWCAYLLLVSLLT